MLDSWAETLVVTLFGPASATETAKPEVVILVSDNQ